MTPIPGPILLLGLPLAAAVLTYLVRRWALAAALISAATTGGLALLCLRLPLDRSAFVFGQEVAFGRPVVVAERVLALDPAGQVWLAFVFVLATVLYLLAWRVDQGRMFFSFSLVILGLYALIALLQTFSLAMLVLAMSATPAVFMLQGENSVRGGQRYLVVTLLAVPLLLAAAWLVDQSVLNAGNLEMARMAALPAALGFGLLLAVFPFGTWMPALAADAPPIAVAFVYTAGQAMPILLALTFLRSVPWSLDNPAALQVIQISGLVTAVSGGLMAAVQRDFGRVLGYAALSDVGCLLLALGLGGSQGVTLALLHGVNRSVSITLMAAALGVVRQRAGTDLFAGLQGWGRRLPIAAAGLLLGGLALAGFPFTSGFPTHWAVARAAAAGLGGWAFLLLAATAGISIGLLRGLGSMGGKATNGDGRGQPLIASLMLAVLGAITIVLGLYPQLFLDPVRRAVEALALF